MRLFQMVFYIPRGYAEYDYVVSCVVHTSPLVIFLITHPWLYWLWWGVLLLFKIDFAGCLWIAVERPNCSKSTNSMLLWARWFCKAFRIGDAQLEVSGGIVGSNKGWGLRLRRHLKGPKLNSLETASKASNWSSTTPCWWWLGLFFRCIKMSFSK